MISVIITAWKEEKTVGRAVHRFIEQTQDIDEDVEIILVAPDKRSRQAGDNAAKQLGFKNFYTIADPKKGKPYALNMAFKEAKGDIFVLSDGDVYIDEKALANLLEPFKSQNISGVTGRPVCIDDRNTIWGYWGHMFMDAAHKKRLETLGQGKFFVMSGYLLAMRNYNIEIPSGILDDIFLSYKIIEQEGEITYAPGAVVYVAQPGNLRDWMKQKVRSVAGHYNLKKFTTMPVVTRSFTGDLEYFFFPFTYSKNIKEFFWTLLHYPLRFYTWLMAWFEIKILKRDVTDIWYRTESTK